jgi:hypothetical protein
MAIVRLEGLGQLKKKTMTSSGVDLPACSIVPQPTALPRTAAAVVVLVIVMLSVLHAHECTYQLLYAFSIRFNSENVTIIPQITADCTVTAIKTLDFKLAL